MPLNVQGQLKDVDQEVCLHLIYETGQRPENQISTLGLVPRQKVESRKQVTESFNIPEGFFNCMVLDSQPTKSVPRRVRLAIERKKDEMCPNRNPMQHKNLDVRGVGTTRRLRGVALFDETCDLTDEEAQEAAVRACRSANPGIIILGNSPNSLEKSFGILHDLVYMATRARCPLHHDPDRFRGCTFRGTVFGAQNAPPERRECLARTGSRQPGTGARLKSNLSAMNRARVWTNSSTMAEHIQQEAIAREGPLYSEELFHLLRTVTQGEALSHAMQFAQRLRDTADEELVTPLGNFVAAAYREPDLAEELDRGSRSRSG